LEIALNDEGLFNWRTALPFGLFGGAIFCW